MKKTSARHTRPAKAAADRTPLSPSARSPRSATNFATARISRRAADRLLVGHPWVYASDIEELFPADGTDTVPPGALVSMQDRRGVALGTAIYSSSSQIALRLIARDAIPNRRAFLDLIRQRAKRAIQMRLEGLRGVTDTDACRLIFGEADELPGIVVDRYGDLAIVQLLTQGTAADDVRAIVTEVVCESIAPQTIVERSDPRIRELEQLPAPPETPLYAADSASPMLATVFQLNGLRFHFDANAGQKTGAFLDQRENYRAAEAHAHGRALDICTYQGGFALHLARRCEQVTGVDVSHAALEVAEKNLEANRAQFEKLRHAANWNIEWIEANAFDLLRDWSDAGEQFDTIVLDPPAFAKSKRAVESAVRGYKEMNLRALKMLRSGGTLVTCSCSHHVSPAEFHAVVAAAAGDASRRVRLIERRGASFDHPAILTIPETQYLKCLICRVE